jgi:hemerythrin superfamily protein
MPEDVVDLIMQDHREVERLFALMQTEPDQRPMLVPVVTSLLVAHSRAEEAEVYPVAREEAGVTEEVRTVRRSTRRLRRSSSGSRPRTTTRRSSTVCSTS